MESSVNYTKKLHMQIYRSRVVTDYSGLICNLQTKVNRVRPLAHVK